MTEIGQKNVLVRVAVVLGFELFLVLGLFLFLEYQSRVIGLAAEERSRMVDNLVNNPSFEPPASMTDQCYGEPIPEGWCCQVWQGDATLLWDEDSNTAFSGTHSVLIIGHSEDVNAAWCTASSRYFPIEADKQYSFTGWIRAEYMLNNARAYLKLRFFDSDNETLHGYASNRIVDSTDGWVQVKGSGVPPAGAVKARLDAKLEGRGYVHFDNVIVSDGPIVPFLVLDGDARPDPVSPTGTLTYIVTLVNTGGSPANPIRLTSTLDSRTTLVYSDTSQVPDELPPEGGSLTVTLVVSVHVETDAHIDLSSTFEVSADIVESTVLTIETSIDPCIDFELSNCGPGWAVPGVSLDYVHTLTNVSNCPISFTTSSFLAPPGCGDVVAHPRNTGSVPSGEPISVTLTFTPDVDPPTNCYAILSAEAPNNVEDASVCHTLVISDWLGLDIVGSSDLVQAGEELTYTLNYTYVGGINADDLRITFTLNGPVVISTCILLSGTEIFDQTCVWSPIPERIGGTGQVTVVASIPAGSTGLFTSTAQIATREAGPVTRVITSEITPSDHEVYLPVIVKNCRFGLCDPDFEHDPFQPQCWDRGWSGNVTAMSPIVVESPLTICPISTGPSNPASGQFAVLLGDPSLGSGNERENIPVGHWWIEQTFPINSVSPPLILTFHYRVLQYGVKRLDAFKVRINNSPVFADGNDNHDFECHDMDWPLPPEAVKDTGWAKVTLPLSSYNTASEITIRFEVWNTDNPDTPNEDYEFYNIWAYVDKVEILR